MRRFSFPAVIPVICFCLIPVRIAAQTPSIRISDALAFRGALAPEVIFAHANSINPAEAMRLFPSLTDADLKSPKAYIKLLPVFYELNQHPEDNSFEKAAQRVISAAWSEAQELIQKAALSQTRPSDLPKIASGLDTLSELRSIFFTEDQRKAILRGYDSAVARLTEIQRRHLEISKQRAAEILNRDLAKLSVHAEDAVVFADKTPWKKGMPLRSKTKTARQAAAGLRRVLSDRATLEEKKAAAVKYGVAVGNQALGEKLVAAMHDEAGLRYPDIILPLSILETLAEFGGREAIDPLLEQVRKRPLSHFRFEQRTNGDIAALVKIAQRHQIEGEVKRRIADILLSRYYTSPSNPGGAQNIVWVLDRVRQSDGFNDARILDFLYSLLNDPNPEVRKTAARSFANRNDPQRVINGLRGVGIQSEYQIEIRKELIDFTIYVDKTLKSNEAIVTEIRKLADGDPSPGVREAVKKVLKRIDNEQAFRAWLRTAPKEEIEALRAKDLRHLAMPPHERTSTAIGPKHVAPSAAPDWHAFLELKTPLPKLGTEKPKAAWKKNFTKQELSKSKIRRAISEHLQPQWNEILQKSDVILFGESHGSLGVLRFLTAELGRLKAAGVRVIGLEGLKTPDQTSMDRYILRRKGPMPLKTVAFPWGRAEDFEKLLKRARRLGIKIAALGMPLHVVEKGVENLAVRLGGLSEHDLPLDIQREIQRTESEEIYEEGISEALFEILINRRNRYMAYRLDQALRHVESAARRQGKGIVLVGDAHIEQSPGFQYESVFQIPARGMATLADRLGTLGRRPFSISVSGGEILHGTTDSGDNKQGLDIFLELWGHHEKPFFAPTSQRTALLNLGKNGI